MNFQKIADIITPLLPVEWSQVRLFCQISPQNYEFFFYVKVGDKYIQNFDLEKHYKITRKEIRHSFDQLYQLMKGSQQIEKWNVATFLCSHSGDFKMQFDYEVTEENVNREYKENWKNIYLD